MHRHDDIKVLLICIYGHIRYVCKYTAMYSLCVSDGAIKAAEIERLHPREKIFSNFFIISVLG